MTRLRNARGNVVLGSIVAVAIFGAVGTAMISSFDSFLRQSRVTYLRSLMQSLDSRVRYLAMQPYAYTCTPSGAGDTTAGLNCRINTKYFEDLFDVKVPGACETVNGDPSCGFTLELIDVAGAGNPGYTTASIAGKTVGVFTYLLKYKGKDHQLAPGGLNGVVDYGTYGKIGMIVPVEVLQSDSFDCAVDDPARPFFQGFGPDGRPICRGFTTAGGGAPSCGQNQYVTSADISTLKLNCANLTTGKKVNCYGPDQTKVSQVQWVRANGAWVIDANPANACSPLPVPPLNSAIAALTPVNGACGPDNGQALGYTPQNLCAAGAPSALAGGGPWTWSCGGINGGTTASCSAEYASNTPPKADVPVYRFYMYSTGEHFLTLNFAEGIGAGFKYEMVAFNVMSKMSAGTRPIFRCYGIGKHFVSSDAACEGYKNEGTYGYIFTDPSAGGNGVRIYRCYEPTNGDHLATTNSEEALINNYKLEYVLGFI